MSCDCDCFDFELEQKKPLAPVDTVVLLESELMHYATADRSGWSFDEHRWADLKIRVCGQQIREIRESRREHDWETRYKNDLAEVLAR